MRVTNVTLKHNDDFSELSAMMGDYRLWYRFPAGYQIAKCGDPFVAAGLLVAMRSGEPLELDVPVSPRLLQGVDKLQDIFRCWGPAFKQSFQRIDIRCPVQPAETCNEGAASFFSGGVDGWYTLIKHREVITDLLFAKGIDMQLHNDTLFEDACKANASTAKEYGKTFVSFATNLRFFAHDHGIGWDPTYVGSGLASIALALSYRVTFIPSTITYAERIPYGTHYLTDPLWSTEATQIVHDGAESARPEKLAVLIKNDLAMSTLRVCWQDKGYNCGKCEKCLRTMISLRLLGASTRTLPELTSAKTIRKLRVDDEEKRSFVGENLALATSVGDEEIAQALRWCLRRYRIRQTAVNLDSDLFGGRLKRVFRRVVPLRD